MQEPNINVWYGSRENPDLSNLAERRFQYESKEYISVEHAYQSLKSGGFDEEIYARDWRAGSKYIGKMGAKTQDNWNLELMRGLIQASLEQNPEIVKQLLQTQGKTITHAQDRGIWNTAFPKILMDLRAYFASHKLGVRVQS